jgi:DNA topoisomerase-1
MAAVLSSPQRSQPTSERCPAFGGTSPLFSVLFNVMDAFNVNAKDAAAAAAGPRSGGGASEKLAKRLGLRLTCAADLTIARRANARGFVYSYQDGRTVRDRALVSRLNRLAVPPAYAEALYCPDAQGHLQAIWRDAAGRLQYRYHSDWDEVRAQRRLRHLARLTKALPRIRRTLARCLAAPTPNRKLALAAVVELAAVSGIRAGRESYARINGTRGAATLLKSNVAFSGERITLSFRAKGGKPMRKDVRSRRLATALARLRRLPGHRMFQYRNGDGEIKSVRAREVNAFLRDLAGVAISLKDLRTLTASAAAVYALTRTVPAKSAARRKRQVRAVMQRVAEELGNTPAICRRSYVPAPLVSAFESGKLRGAGRLSSERVLAGLLAQPPRRRRASPNLKTQLQRSVRRLSRARSR